MKKVFAVVQNSFAALLLLLESSVRDQLTATTRGIQV
jgi:hypothetical protein